MLAHKTIGFIGAGSMAEAILEGLITEKKVKPHQVSMVNRQNRTRIKEICQKYGLDWTKQSEENVAGAEIVILAVKPKDTVEVLKKWGERLQDGQILISAVAGITTEFIDNYLQNRVSVMRVMPNTSCRVGRSATAMSKGSRATREAVEITREIFSTIGLVVMVEEALMDAVTGLSGSGPAYIYTMTEAMESAGVSAGLDPETARILTVQTLLGAAYMLMESGKNARQLCEEVTSPGGTTMAGLQALRDYRFDEAVKAAVLKAAKRAGELGKQHASY